MTTTPVTASALLDRFDRSWDDLQATIAQYPERQLVDVRDSAGWSAKDHLMHVAVWEQALLAKLDGHPRHEALGIDVATDASGDDDTINAAIFAATRDRPFPDVLDVLRRTHARTRRELLAAVQRETGSSPQSGGAEATEAILADLPGYVDHYDQHREWIRALLARA